MTTNEPPEYPDYGSVPDQGGTPPPPGAPGEYGAQPPSPPPGTPGGYGAQPPYPPPGPPVWYGPPGGYQPAPPASQKAMWSMISGITGVALVLLCFGGLGLCLIPGIVAIVLGMQAKGEIARSNGTLSGHGQAIAGLVMGIVTVVITVVVGVLVVALFAGT